MRSAIVGAFAKLRKATINIVISVLPSAWNIWAPSWRIFMIFDIWVFFSNLYRKLRFYSTLTRMTATVPEDLCTCMTISRSVFLRMRNIWDGSFGENQNTHFMFNNLLPFLSFFLSFFLENSCRLWDYTAKYGAAGLAADEHTTGRMRFAYWTNNTSDTTHSECVILIAFRRQQWLRERTSLLRYTYITYLV